MRIGVIHATMDAVKPLADSIHAISPEVEVVNFVNEELLARATRVGGVDAAGLRSFFLMGNLCANAMLDGVIIACSMYATYYADLQKILDIPVMAIDTAMVEEAASFCGKIGVLATNKPAAADEEKKIREAARRRNLTADLSARACLEAPAFLKAGQIEEFHRILKDEAAGLIAEGCGCIVLSQITMASAAESIRELGIPCLTSPETGAMAMITEIRKRTNQQ